MWILNNEYFNNWIVNNNVAITMDRYTNKYDLQII